MKICKLCNKEFKILVSVEGKVRNFGNRKYCLDCSPFGTGNTKNLTKDVVFKCKDCGESHHNQFYGHKRGKCAACHNKQIHIEGREKRLFAINLLGGKCSACGYDKFPCSLDIHHIDPLLKDKKFAHMRYWSLKKIENELTLCTLLCRNCHFALHNGYDVNIIGL